MTGKIEITSMESPYCLGVTINNEDHTFGALIQHFISQNPLVELCGYTRPHPSEYKIILRIQTIEPLSASDAFFDGMKRMKQYMTQLKEQYISASSSFPINVDTN